MAIHVAISYCRQGHSSLPAGSCESINPTRAAKSGSSLSRSESPPPGCGPSTSGAAPLPSGDILAGPAACAVLGAPSGDAGAEGRCSGVGCAPETAAGAESAAPSLLEERVACARFAAASAAAPAALRCRAWIGKLIGAATWL